MPEKRKRAPGAGRKPSPDFDSIPAAEPTTDEDGNPEPCTAGVSIPVWCEYEPEVAIEQLRKKGTFCDPPQGRNVYIHMEIIERFQSGGLKIQVSYAPMTSYSNVDRTRWLGSSVGEKIVSTYLLLPISERWETQWLEANRAAAVKAVAEAKTLRSAGWERCYGDMTLRQRMTTHAFRMALYFGLITRDEADRVPTLRGEEDVAL